MYLQNFTAPYCPMQLYLVQNLFVIVVFPDHTHYNTNKIVSEYDQEIPKSHTADQPTAL